MNKRTTICILLPEHFSSNMGGAEYQANLLVDALCETKKYDIFYLCHRADEHYKPKEYKIRVIGKSKILINSFPFLSAWQVYSELKKIRPSIIYQNVGGFQTGVAAYYAKKHGAKFIWHIASDDDLSPQWKNNIKRAIRLAPERLFLNYGIKNSDIIAAQTKYQTYILKKKFGIDCQTFIPIGHPYPEEELDKSNRLSILWVANMKPLKRPEIFVRLAQHFRNRRDVLFTMIGHPGWGKWFEKIISEIQNLSNMEYVGKLTQGEVNRYLSKGHILVNTSRYEGFSNTFVQAWMRKVPVVSLSVDPDNILENEHIGFRSGTFEKLCRDTNSLIVDKELREDMGKRALDYARKNHSIDKMITHATNLFA